MAGEAVSAAVADMKKELRDAVSEALRVVAHALLVDSRAFVPVLSGKLLDSGRVERVEGLANGIVYWRVVYGNDLIPYALTQHEDPYNHPSLGFFGRARYLQRPWELNKRFYHELFQLVLRQRIQV